MIQHTGRDEAGAVVLIQSMWLDEFHTPALTHRWAGACNDARALISTLTLGEMGVKVREVLLLLCYYRLLPQLTVTA